MKKDDGTRRCGYCEKTKPISQYLRLPYAGVKVTYCNECAQYLMLKYIASQSVGKKAPGSQIG